jgi:hypothetical protein
MKTLVTILLALGATSAWGQCSPIVVDLDMDGILFGPAGRGVYFDVNADGFPDLVQWVRPGGDEAFLVLDRNGNGLVDDGSELFGVGTPLFEGGKAPNGFVGLAQYDQPLLGGNDDGLISAGDPIWSRLALWLDSNADGVSTPDEMRRLDSAGFTSFGTIPKVRRYVDEAGNALPYWAWATTTLADRKTIMVDVYFQLLDPDDRGTTPTATCPANRPPLV